MEEKINVAEILKDKPLNTKLYSPLYGDVYFSYIGVRNNISILHHRFILSDFFYNGRYTAYKESEIMLFPSKEMRDWSKFAWKKGDLLVNSCGFQCIFKEWASDDYTKFNGCYSNSRDGYEDVSNAETAKFDKLDNNIAYGYVREIERKFGGILNLETLEIEKAQPEFKDGDVLFVRCEDDSFIEIFNYSEKNGDLYDHASLNTRTQVLDISGRYKIRKDEIVELRLATEAEKQQLFSALKKQSKAWDAEKKAIVDLKPKCEFKPMDLCLMKYIGQYNNRGWELCQYAYTEHRVSSSGEHRDFYHAVGGEIYAECIPYNEDTKHLLGTKDKWKGGEG